MKSLLFDFFGWMFVVLILQTMTNITVGVYNMVRIPQRFVQLLAFVLSSFFFLTLYSGVGENFKNKILASADLLREYSTLSSHLPLKAQVQRLCEQLEAMAPVTLQGMVTLGYANIPSVSPVKRHFGRESCPRW
ncbi:hypothetical protein E2C01_026310 [Portunus trituberculatus]|uniref:Uncharacterized protein n=1 Tax=Portunus trituberculatus TaxID=210409 RepID=A0A5B7EFN3_PORTR|nr:hypothetical protein [Portunus trituberculatus]